MKINHSFIGFLVIIFVGVILNLSGCKPRTGLVGTWIWSEGSASEDATLIFREDFTVDLHMDDKVLQGKYEIQQSGTLVCKWEDGATEKYLFRNDRIEIGGSYPMLLKRK